jgi:C4-dicarboxylate transporter
MRRKYEDNRKNGWGWIWYLIITIFLSIIVLYLRSVISELKETNEKFDKANKGMEDTFIPILKSILKFIYSSGI